MASSATYDALRTLLANAMVGYPVLRWEDVDPDSEQSGLPFFALEDGLATESADSIGSPPLHCLREEGEMLVHVYTTSSENLETARSLGDQARAALRYKKVLTAVGWLETRNAGPPMQEFVNDGLWSSMTVPVDYVLHFKE